MMTTRAVAIALATLALVAHAIAQDGDRERYRIIAAYAMNSATDAKLLMVANNPAEASAAAETFANKTDKAFQQLSEKQLLDRKLVVYQSHWGSLKTALRANPLDKLTIAKVDLFGTEVVKAAKGGTCTIVISASQGLGAVVQYAKAHDADLGRGYKQLPGTTTMVHELERAEYKFKCFRGGKETGTTGVVACTESRVPVQLVISE